MTTPTSRSRNRAAGRRTTKRTPAPRGGGRPRKTTEAAVTTPSATTSTATASSGSGGGRRGASGSPRLAETLTSLLAEVGSEVETVTALSGRIDEAARALQEQLAEFAERIATLSQLRATVPGGTLATFLDETLVPGRPSELDTLSQRIRAANAATI